MTTKKPVLVLFPGFLGNNNSHSAQWWFSLIARYFRRDYEIVFITYQGKSLREYVASATLQLGPYVNENRQLYAIGYSLGAQVIRGVSEHAPDLFEAVALLSGLENFGLRTKVFSRLVLTLLWPLVRCVFSGTLALNKPRYIKRLFLNGIREDSQTGGLDQILGHIHPEPRMTIFQTLVPVTRVRYPGLTCRTIVIIPNQDILVRDAQYIQDRVLRTIHCNGDHVYYALNSKTLSFTLSKIKRFLADR